MHRPTTLNEETRKPDKVRVLMFSGYSEENEGNLMRTASRVVEECKKKGIECFVGFVPYARSYKNDDGTRRISSQVIWDGETYYHNYGNFCSTGCAIQYANIIVDRSGLNNSNKVKRGEY
jgi:hypothetical protein